LSEKRILTGIEGLDSLIEGGVPRGSLILLAGSPGSGKTVFGTKFLCKGAKDLDEAGIHVTFAESKETFVHNMSRHVGRDFERSLKNGKLKVLDFITVKEKGVSAVLESILVEVEKAKAKRLVIDSYSAMAQAFVEKIEARIIVHSILGKLVRGLGCTTILISEVPRGQERIGMGIEEFVTDGVILFKDIDVHGESLDGQIYPEQLEIRTARAMEIVKLRGTMRAQKRCIFTLKDGFQCFGPYRENLDMTGRKSIPDVDREHISSGIKDLDKITGGFLKGSFNLLEIEHGVDRRYMELVRQI